MSNNVFGTGIDELDVSRYPECPVCNSIVERRGCDGQFCSSPKCETYGVMLTEWDALKNKNADS